MSNDYVFVYVWQGPGVALIKTNTHLWVWLRVSNTNGH